MSALVSEHVVTTVRIKKNNFVGVISPRRTTVVYNFSLSLLVADIKCVTDGQKETVNDTQMIPCTVHILMYYFTYMLNAYAKNRV